MLAATGPTTNYLEPNYALKGQKLLPPLVVIHFDTQVFPNHNQKNSITGVMVHIF